ncbi:hypothetical protein [Cryptosporangium aurantiacum]|uniref:Uncharacterized protein n=1 Tax=Cryptosporangium aurantiacum TaxID=134849 RepID=A0A1M7HKL6_9ACTN|nr:hypothetical protein [Cryptosporangium aurantiacum]SHM29014.1 hypothetical protein SAMN05443668_101217 [Cryptosporangium aurantiacum]
MSTDHDQLAARFGAFRAAIAPTMTGPGAPEIRADVRRRHRRTAVAGVAAVVLVLVGAGAFLLRPADDTNRLIPATASTSPSADPSADPSPSPDDTWKQTVRNGRMDLTAETNANCGGPAVTFRDGKAKAWYDGVNKNYAVLDDNMFRADIDRDGRPDYLVTLSCDFGRDPATIECDPRMSKEACEAQRKSGVITQLFVLRGEPGDLTAIGGIRAGSLLTPPARVEISDDGLISISDDREPGRVLVWAYRDGTMKVVENIKASPTPTA